jgi:O-acetyl-ADP-ribose deacetylase (regulator of RNase III)
MTITIGNTLLELMFGDIAAQKVEAIVNAANKGLAGGGGVDGAIHRAGGPQIMAECRKIGGCPVGQAVVTGGGNLQARYVIHTVGPIYNPGSQEQSELLAAAYRNSLQRAVENGVHSIAFPSISTGAYRYPVCDAAHIALTETIRFLREEEHHLHVVRFVLFDEKSLRIYTEVLGRLT